MVVQKVKLRIYGMTCDDCTFTISKSLMAQSGVKTADISLRTGTGEITIDQELATPEDLLKNEVFSKKSHYKATIVD